MSNLPRPQRIGRLSARARRLFWVYRAARALAQALQPVAGVRDSHPV